MSSSLQDFLYIIASVLFIYGLKMLSKAESARRGNLVSAVGMLARFCCAPHQGH
ncbi:MAG: NAD(P)(+) transhydrogenase (Re/Si-specific) subunit beta [Deinococcales bacterium]